MIFHLALNLKRIRVEYIRNGKITFKESYYYQDVGARISDVEIEEGEGFLTPEVRDKLIEGTFNVNIWPLLDAVSFKGLDRHNGIG